MKIVVKRDMEVESDYGRYLPKRMRKKFEKNKTEVTGIVESNRSINDIKKLKNKARKYNFWAKAAPFLAYGIPTLLSSIGSNFGGPNLADFCNDYGLSLSMFAGSATLAGVIGFAKPQDSSSYKMAQKIREKMSYTKIV